ncbi:triacylglycerol lipase [Vitiosangium sp. GDMCC 1.1324]|uniref:esterase/lipase family protein n=1 Tax=Vitiosangium sp. (strain GDMCC 1.1324) TaxID=2138576 RepID=UPI000D35CC55|nr:alpha/beta fold hydrolase [Vitiosangium sp. GDMCC 1.1324]PTL76222.1 hypothetical protein DAT35_50145 [Vitiosangium sp. GDMCC 1.1324]
MSLMLLWVVLALVVLGGVGVLGFRYLRTLRVRRAVRGLRHPVVLVHGLLGFDELKLGQSRHQYFRGVPERLRQLGSDVYVVKVPPTGSVAERAEALAQAVRSLDAKRVNIIAHSMGGLDARYAIAHLGLASRVASLITIGTPHQGTPLADMGTKVLGDALGLKRVCEALAVSTGAFYDLTTTKMAEFNRAVPDAPGVRYASYVGAFPRSIRALNPILLPSYLYLTRSVGPNDGVVPADSQKWGEVLGTIEADHWAQIGWSSRFDAEAFYVSLFQALRERNL